MGKKGKLYTGLVSLTVVIIVFLEMTKPKDINWFPSYATHHKIPLGSYVFNEQLQRIATNIETVARPPFEYLKENDVQGTYLFYNGGINYGKEELDAILDWVSNGNRLIVAAVDFEPQFLDTLHLNTKTVKTYDNFNKAYQVNLVNPQLNPNTTYKYSSDNTFYYFNKIDTTQTTILGFMDTYGNATSNDALVNIIKQPFGEGEIILSTFPQAFTNYFILESPNQDYTAGLLSYIDTNKTVYVDTYYKNGKKFYSSPMYLFLSTASLKWAYYTMLIGILIYIIFEGKRKQRAIPVISPLKNQTLDFTRTIANMYYEKGKHKAISSHKITHFLEYIRSTMHLSTSTIDTTFIKHLAARSNNTISDTQTLFNHIDALHTKTTITQTELERLNTLIEQFKSHNQWKTKQ